MSTIDIPLYVAVTALVMTGALHSVLGERFILRPLFAARGCQTLALGEGFTTRTLRFAWHLTTLAWWTIALAVAQPTLLVPAAILLAFASAVVCAVVARGEHFAWPIFATVGVLLVPSDILGAAVTQTIVGGVAALTLLSLAGLHVYWALGGRRGLAHAVPQLDGEPVFRPGPTVTLAVGAALLGAALLVGHGAQWLALPLPDRLVEFGLAALAAVFAFRVVGDFRYSGLLKSHRTSDYARWDTRLYVPLCWALAAGVYVVAH